MILKEEYNEAFVEDLAAKFSAKASFFNPASFVKSIINKDWREKELKERMRCITDTVHEHLPIPYEKQLTILNSIAPNYSGIQGFIFPDFVQVHGLNNLNASLDALESFTKFSTSEFAIRVFIQKYPTKTMQRILEWSTHKNHHIRRLASEGCRPRLPWAPPLRAFITNPKPVLPILENLMKDDSLYVKKSVANHLNDISKDHPELVLKIAKKWHGTSDHTNWIIKHALRTLLKKGNKKALAIFGLDDSHQIETSKLSLSKKEIPIGDFIHFEFEVINNSTKIRNIRLEYGIDFVKANKSTSRKVFQISEFSLKPNATKAFKRKQSFKELTTRKHYPGEHQITLIINGDEKETIRLRLTEA